MLRTCFASLFFIVVLTAPAFGAGDTVVPASRGSVLPALYVSFAALTVYDAASTTAALGRGAREANPVMVGIAGNSSALWAVKGGVTVASISIAERLWRQHRRSQAIVMMMAMNGVLAAVAAHNSAVLRDLK
jgi:hypothetical protein